MIRHVTRFTEEIFALIIALVYLYEPFKKLYRVRHRSMSQLSRRFDRSLCLDLPLQSGSFTAQLRLSRDVLVRYLIGVQLIEVFVLRLRTARTVLISTAVQYDIRVQR